MCVQYSLLKVYHKRLKRRNMFDLENMLIYEQFSCKKNIYFLDVCGKQTWTHTQE